MTNSEAIEILKESAARNKKSLELGADMMSGEVVEWVNKETEALTKAISLLEAEGEGRLAIYPVVIGTVVYVLPHYPAYWNDIEKTTIKAVTQYYRDGVVSSEVVTGLGLCYEWERDFGKVLFLTKEAAEESLNGDKR